MLPEEERASDMAGGFSDGQPGREEPIIVSPSGGASVAERRGAREIAATFPEVLGRDGPEAREAMIWTEVERGNYPVWTGTLVPVVLTDRRKRTARVYVSVDCFAIGTDQDWMRVQASGYLAQRIADHFGCLLPTNKIVFEAYKQAKIRLIAHIFDCQTVGAGKWQRSTLAWRLHEDVLSGRVACKRGQIVSNLAGKLNPRLGEHTGQCCLPSGPHPSVLVAGHLKEVTINGEDLTKKLAFAGFFPPNGQPLQKGYGGPHGPGYADYSHGCRIVSRKAELDGKEVEYEDLVTNPANAELMFALGGVCRKPPRYPPPPAKYFMGA